MEEQYKNEINLSNNRKFLRNFISGTFLVLAIFGIGFFEGRRISDSDSSLGQAPIDNTVITNKETPGDIKADFSLFWRAWNILEQKYVDHESLDVNKMIYGAINGMFYSTGDPYTVFLDPEENRRFNEEIDGNFEGIGAELGVKDGILTVVAPLEGTPAEKAGLRSGDKIIQIDGEPAADMTVDEAVNRIRGQKGTTVTLTIYREGNEEAFDVEVKRDIISVKSVKFEMKEGQIAYIKISRFGNETVREFLEVVLRQEVLRAKGVVLDLRNNPGGYLEGAVDIASKMIPKGKVVLIEEDAKKNQKKMYADGGDVLSGIKTVVLINEGSASASEILAGALKDNRDNVTLVGMKSFGKGSVQEMIDMPKNTAVKITVARWLTPLGIQITKKGIEPQVEVPISEEDYKSDRDPQLDKALEILKQ